MALFARNEYFTRLQKTKESMAQQDLEVLLLADPANMNYLTGYDGWSFYTPQLVIVSLDAEQPTWVGREMDAKGAVYTTFLAPENIIGYPDHYVQSPVRHPMQFAAEVLKQRGLVQRRIGVEMDAYYFTAKCFAELQRSLPESRFTDASLLVNWVRIIKSAQELEYMKQAGRIMEKVMQTALDTIAPGVRECDAVAAITSAQISGTEQFGGDFTAIVPLMPTGEKTSTPHLTWTDQPYQDETAVNLELAACRQHYHSPMARTVYLGRKPPQKLRDTAEAVVEGLHAALDAVKPGVVCEEVEAVWRRTIAKVGLVKESRIGYALGLNYPPDWGEHTASLRPGDRTVLRSNMTFHMIPGMWMDGWGFECSEAFAVTENGCETFADFPRRLFVKS